MSRVLVERVTCDQCGDQIERDAKADGDHGWVAVTWYDPGYDAAHQKQSKLVCGVRCAVAMLRVAPAVAP